MATDLRQGTTPGLPRLAMAAKMKEVGLQPTNTGEPDGKGVEQNVTHYIIPSGVYAAAYARLAATGFHLNWQSQPFSPERKKKAASKTKYMPDVCNESIGEARDCPDLRRAL